MNRRLIVGDSSGSEDKEPVEKVKKVSGKEPVGAGKKDAAWWAKAKAQTETEGGRRQWPSATATASTGENDFQRTVDILDMCFLTY